MHTWHRLKPYAVTRTWHTQLAVLWIATAWLATGLYVAPLFGGREPRWQSAGVWFLLVSLVILFVRPPNRVRRVEVGPDADTEIGAQ